MPLVEEGWDLIAVNPLKDIDSQAPLYQLDKFLLGQTPHNCAPYHLETIETHMKAAYLLAKRCDEPECLQIALKYHDIGKFFTQNGMKRKVEIHFIATKIGVLISIYALLLIFDLRAKNEAEAIAIATLISEHMEPHLNSWCEKKNFYGENFRNLLGLMANYDDWASIKK